MKTLGITDVLRGGGDVDDAPLLALVFDGGDEAFVALTMGFVFFFFAPMFFILAVDPETNSLANYLTK